MEMRDLLEKMMKFAGEKVGQKPGDQWRGSDKAPPGKKLVGDSILKDLSKGPTPKSKEQELSEEYKAFLEAEFKDTVDKRPRRKSDRHPRGHEPKSGYKTVKAENWPKMVEFTSEIVTILKNKGYKGPHKLSAFKNLYRQLNGVEGISGDDNIMIKGSHWVISAGSKFLVGAEGQMAPATTNQLLKYLGESSMSDKDIELQDYRSMTHKEFQTAYGMTKTEWMNKNKALVIKNPDIKKALGLEEAVSQEYTVVIDRKGREKPVTGTMEELLGYFGYTLEVGKSYEHERGRYKINLAPKNVVQLVDALNKAKSNAAANGHSDTYYSVGQGQIAESHYKWEVTFKDGKQAIYHHNSPHYKDDTAASDIQYTLKSNPGATVKAYKDDKPFDWESLLSEGWESGPEEYQEPYDDADDAYERQRQEKIDTEAEREWAKLPKVSTYKLLGRGPNMEPNYEFDGKEYDTLEQALAAREQLMNDPKTPHPEHIGIQTLTRVVDKEQTNEAVYTAPKNREEYDAKMAALQDLQNDPNTANDPELQKKIIIYMDNLQKVAHQHGWLSQPLESRGHKIIATKLKDIERAKRFASGELNIPTPQERQAQLKKLEKGTEKKTVKELMATPPQGTANQTMQQKTQAQDPKQAQAVAQAAQAMKSATGSSASATTLAKALDTASQGRPVQGQEATALQPLMKDMATVAQDPKLSGQFKSLVNQINQAQLKQK